MTYTIKEIANLAGVTTRTLRYYDEIGLLPPAGKGENGYRYYDRESLLQLQQILFFRELELPLEEIQMIMSQPEFSMIEALQNHQTALKARANKIDRLLLTIDRTISHFKGEIPMAPEKLFEGFDESKYAEEAAERWGGTSQYTESQRNWSSYSAEKKKEIKEEGGRIFEQMVGTESSEPSDVEIQEAVEKYYSYLTENFYSCSLEFLGQLATGWVSDPRFSRVFEKIREGGAKFARDAVTLYVEQNT